MMSRKTRLLSNRLLYWMLSSTLLIDSLNGLLSGLYIGEIFRVILMGVCIYELILLRKKEVLLVISVIVFLFVNMLSSILSSQHNISQDISVGLKSMITITVASTLIAMYKKEKLQFSIGRVLYNNLLYGPGLIILSGFLGVGSSSYDWADSTIGFKGTFLSLNSMNVALMVLFLYTVNKVILERKKGKWVLLCIYIAVPMIRLGTKTALIIIVIGPLLFWLLNSKKKVAIKCLYALPLAIFAMFLFQDKINSVLNPILLRQTYLLNQRGFSTYLFSTRNTRVLELSSTYFSNFSSIDIFPGRGYSPSHYLLGMNNGKTALPIEMDFMDILVSYGIFGLIYTYAYSFKLILSAKNLWNDKTGQFYFWTGLIVIAYGSMAGHVFLEAISSTFFALIIAGCFICNREKSNGYE